MALWVPEAFTDLLSEHNIQYDDREILIMTGYMAMGDVAKAAVSFSYFMARVKNLTLLIGSRVQRSFIRPRLITSTRLCLRYRSRPINRENYGFRQIEFYRIAIDEPRRKFRT